MSEAAAKIHRLLPQKSMRLLTECRDLTVGRLVPVLKGIMDRVDDALFDYANHADSSTQQNLYFDGMREVRKKRAHIEETLVAHLKRNFDEALEVHGAMPRSASAREPGASADVFELSLVGADEMEEQLAVASLSEKLTAQCREQLSALDRRVGSLLSDPELETSRNPFEPGLIGDALKAAVACVESDIQIRLFVFKVFDQHLGPELVQIYRQVNDKLVENGVLANLGAAHARRPGPGRTRVTIESDSGTVSSEGNDMFSTLQGLMQNTGGAVPGVGGFGSGVAGGGVAGGGVAGGGVAGGGVAGGGVAGGGVAGGGVAGGGVAGGGVAGGGVAGGGIAGGGIAGGGIAGGGVAGSGIAGSGIAGSGIAGSGIAGGGVAGGGVAGGGVAGGGVAGGGVAGAGEAGGGVAGAGATGGAGGGVMLSPTAVVQRLDAIQHWSDPDLAATHPQLEGMISTGQVNVLHALKETGAIGQMNETDTTTLDIVALLFDYILGDPALPAPIKALLGRLQIPMLKVATLDKSLFSKKAHPARRLLDVMAGASIGWSEGSASGEALYAKVEATVTRILEEFDTDLSLFETLREDFEAFLEKHTAAADARASHAANSLKTRERIVHAKFEVDGALKEVFKGRQVRGFVKDFVLDYWRQLLIVTFIEQGRDSEAFTDQIALADRLVDSVQPAGSAEERKQLTASLPKLISGLKKGMAALEMPPAKASEFLAMLASVHVVSVKTDAQASLAERRLADHQMATFDGDAIFDVTGETAADVPAEAERLKAEDEFVKAQLARLFDKEAIASEDLDIDFGALEPEPADPAATDATAEDFGGVSPAAAELVMELDLGDWVEFAQDDGSTLRARFTFISPTTGAYLFTDRDGHRALDTTFEALAAVFEDGSARRVAGSDDPLFDRAIGDLVERFSEVAA